MNKKTINRIYIAVSAIFAAAGIIFLCLSIFTEMKNNTYLNIALVSILLYNVLNHIRVQVNKKNQ